MPRDEQARRDEITKRAKQAADAAPALTSEQRARLAGLLKQQPTATKKPKPLEPFSEQEWQHLGEVVADTRKKQDRSSRRLAS